MKNLACVQPAAFLSCNHWNFADTMEKWQCKFIENKLPRRNCQPVWISSVLISLPCMDQYSAKEFGGKAILVHESKHLHVRCVFVLKCERKNMSPYKQSSLLCTRLCRFFGFDANSCQSVSFVLSPLDHLPSRTESSLLLTRIANARNSATYDCVFKTSFGFALRFDFISPTLHHLFTNSNSVLNQSTRKKLKLGCAVHKRRGSED